MEALEREGDFPAAAHHMKMSAGFLSMGAPGGGRSTASTQKTQCCSPTSIHRLSTRTGENIMQDLSFL